MKSLVLFLSLSTSCYSQRSYVNNERVVSNLSMDTVYILDTELGKLIYSSWLSDPQYAGQIVTPILVKNLSKYRIRYQYLATMEESKNKKKND